jgi:phage head maturation protease
MAVASRATSSGVTQMSVGFIVADGGDRWNEGWTNREIRSFASLEDVSAVVYPASRSTGIALAGTRGAA